MHQFNSQGPLSAAELEQFDREGYVVVEGVYSDAALEPIRLEINALVTEVAQELVDQGKLTQTYETGGFDRQLALIDEELDGTAGRMADGKYVGMPAMFGAVTHEPLVDIAAQLCGPELIGSSVYRLRPKTPTFANGPVPWHQDAGYIHPFCDDGFMLTAWAALVDANQTNGCMWVIPGVHKQGVYRHALRQDKPFLIIPRDDLPPVEPVCVPVPKGGVLLLTNMTPHASFENKTDQVRWSLDMRYQSAALPTNADISRLPGELVLDEQANVPCACYPPEADFLVRSEHRPDEVVTDPEAFYRIRNEYIKQSMPARWHDVVAE